MRSRTGALLGGVFLIAPFLGGLASEAGAADWYTGVEPTPGDWIVAVDASATASTTGSYFAGVTVTGAAAGKLSESGPRVRVEGIGGQYRYRAAAGNTVIGDQVDGAALAGYEWVSKDSAVAGYLGVNVRNTTLSSAGVDMRSDGATVGFKGVLEAYVKPTSRTVLQAYGSYSTAYNAYYGRVRGGVSVFDLGYAGPEVAVMGDDLFTQFRVGAHFSGIQLGPLQFGISGGYQRDQTGKEGAYASLDMRAGF